MFETLELQYVNKLSKRKVGDFTSPKPFHTFKVQRLGSDKVKPSAKVCGKFVVPVFALVSNMPIQPRKLSDTTPPIVRTFYLSADSFVECVKFAQGLFQKLWRLFLLAVAKCQVGFHTEIYPYALTCSRIRFGNGGVCNHVKVVCADSITQYLNIANFTVPVAMLVKREPTFFELQGLSRCVPGFQRKSNTPFFKEIRRLELRRTIPIFTLELWKSTESIKKTFISDMDTDNHFVKRIAGYPSPVLMRAFEQLRQVRLQAKTPRIFPVSTVISLFQLQKVIMDIRKVVKHIPETHILWVFAQLELVCSTILFLFAFPHGVSRVTLLSPIQWEETSTLPSGNAESAGLQREAYIKSQLTNFVKDFFQKTLWSHTRGRTFLPLPKGRGLQSVNLDEYERVIVVNRHAAVTCQYGVHRKQGANHNNRFSHFYFSTGGSGVPIHRVPFQ